MLTIIKLIFVGSKILWISRLRLTNGDGDVVVLVDFADVVTTDIFLSICIKNKSETIDTTEKLMSGIRLEGLLIFSKYDSASKKKVIVTANVTAPLISTNHSNVVQNMEAANILKEVVPIISRACIKKVALVSTQILPGFNMCYLYIRS
jgi:hypothetical protein